MDGERARTAASRATGARSMRSSRSRAMAAPRSPSSCSGGPMRCRSASPHGADPRSCGRAPIVILRELRSGRGFPTRCTVGGMTIEAAARIAPDVLWFQLYRFGGDGHRVGFDLVRRDGSARWWSRHPAPGRRREGGVSQRRRHSCRIMAAARSRRCRPWVSQVGSRATVLMDSGIRYGVDAGGALALGAATTPRAVEVRHPGALGFCAVPTTSLCFAH